jgi:hypothetical protein
MHIPTRLATNTPLLALQVVHLETCGHADEDGSRRIAWTQRADEANATRRVGSSVRHRLDPVGLHHAAERLGELVAADHLTERDAAETITSWAKNATGVDRFGLQTRLNWAMRDQAKALHRRRDNTAIAIGWAVRPLFRARASAADIEEAAAKANGDVLAWAEVAAILRAERLSAVKAKRA